MATRKQTRESTIDLELIAQRILKLAEISTLEHLEALARSQADGLMAMFENSTGEFPYDGPSA